MRLQPSDYFSTDFSLLPSSFYVFSLWHWRSLFQVFRPPPFTSLRSRFAVSTVVNLFFSSPLEVPLFWFMTLLSRSVIFRLSLVAPSSFLSLSLFLSASTWMSLNTLSRFWLFRSFVFFNTQFFSRFICFDDVSLVLIEVTKRFVRSTAGLFRVLALSSTKRWGLWLMLKL